ncbi:uncharacterized protein LOC113229554 isoform X1 [Hyposmocoma kahamanoa]|uniref:uncharacterized protein LOC113229554 isoform X1 n=1 Tax=Hyposmocoma kahamanoa TaxID=1477025 RepID=UPI000E6D654A|nr:uncharacterized protein LOC113229554 isoform X1 [Hyposmocoma kahamanoa]
MGLTIVLLTLVLCAVIININCESTNCINCSTSDYVRIKRVKYSYPPQRSYRLPVVEPIRGLFPYTPPPNYVIDDEKQIPLFKPPRVTTTRQKSPVLQLSSSSSSLSASQKYPEIEYAPPDATGKEHSDAHLKAVKIWTHKSKGTAYTLHDDGTLSLELPLPKKQGH